MRKCAVINCAFECHIFHQFPNDAIRATLWLKACGNPNLLEINWERLKNLHICRKHFDEKYLMRNNKLSRAAVPTLYLPEAIRDVGFDALPSTSKQITVQAQMGTENPVEVIKSYKCLSRKPVIRMKALRPNERLLHKEIVNLKRKFINCKKRNLNLRSRIHEVEDILKTGNFINQCKMHPVAHNFFKCQIINNQKHRKGMRFILDDKILALSLYKRAARAYKFLSKVFLLPTARSLRKVLQNVRIQPGICKNLFQTLTFQGKKMSKEEKVCILVFDEMSIQPHLDYLKSKDLVEGFADDGTERRLEIADHVLVWMLKGVAKTWKQPIAYSFCKSTTSAATIVNNFKTIVEKTQEAGFNIIASVCDQGSTNIKAINILLEETRRAYPIQGRNLNENVIMVGKNKVIPLFDPPHLLKAFRNNLLKKNLNFTVDGVQRSAKWSHIMDAYYIDISLGDLRLMPKLSELHVIPERIKKMKVSVCTQVFSASVAAGINNYSESQKSVGGRIMERAGIDTAYLCNFLDKLFDSVNGGFDGSNKRLRLPVKCREASPQASFWSKAICVFESMAFVKQRPNDRARPQVLSNFIFTLKGFHLIRGVLKDLGYDSFNPRVFNQDALENFFGQVRQFGCRNINPTTTCFAGYYKSLLVSNLSQTHLSTFNCENDPSEGILLSVKYFLSNLSQQEVPDPLDEFILPPPDLNLPLNLDALYYISGYVINNIFSYCKTCHVCLSNIMHDSGDDSAVVDDDLKNCSELFINALRKLHTYILWYLSKHCHKRFLKENLMCWLNLLDVFGDFVECEHLPEIQKFLMSKFTNLLIKNYITICNKIIAGKESITFVNDDFQKSLV